MKNQMIKYLTVSAFAASVLLSGSASALAGKYRLQVDGLACPFCAYGIEKQLKKTSGVTKVSVKINAGVVVVTMAKNTAMSKSQASGIVKKAGFSLRGFKKIN